MGHASVERPTTRKIILTTSTLFNVWNHPSFKPDIYMDNEANVGGRFRYSTRSMSLGCQYRLTPRCTTTSLSV